MLSESTDNLIQKLKQGDKRALARCISMVENESAGSETLLSNLPIPTNVSVVGITGPPGAGKSTLISALIGCLKSRNKKVAVIAVDPSSPFNKGALMGDRVRMSEHFLKEDVFIRSMASRGSLGGLAPKVIEACDLLKAAGFDYVIIETVGVGQSEVEIAGIADTTVLVLVPEAGDEIQTIKSGVMEIADIFVLNKSDRDGAAAFSKNLKLLAHEHALPGWEAPVVSTVALRQEGISELADAIEKHGAAETDRERKTQVLAERAMVLIRNYRTRDIDFNHLVSQLKAAQDKPGFNFYAFTRSFVG